MIEGLYFNGVWSDGSGAEFVNHCPATGEVTWRGHAASADEVHTAVSLARRALPDWAGLPQSDRTKIMESYAEEIGKRSEKIAEAISRDMGKMLWDSAGEAGAMKAKVAVSIKAQVERAGTRMEDAAFGSAHLTHRPHGVMAVFGPFNFPGHLPNGHMVPALLAGNTCVFKPSELAPSVAALMIEAFEAAGLPSGVVNVVQGGRETGDALLKSEIDGLLFTGSARTGVHFHKHFAGRPEVLLALELGGNNPLIIWDPADVDAAADIAAQSAFLTSGQRCSCARRVILPEGVFGDKVVDAIVARATGIEMGAWYEEGKFMGPLVSENAALQAVEFQSMLLAKGGKALRQLEHTERETGFVTAGVIDVTGANDIPDEELFGPVMQIIRVPDFDTAIARANDTSFGLSGGLISDDDALWLETHKRLRAGILNRNRPTAGAGGNMPFGGPGLSGNARPGAYYAADYCAWPQASQVSDKATRLGAQGFPK